ncbi:MAG: hypothetical protein UX41_C0011G0010 [Candidatus Collierbacteria bacterium GW2011_GWE1_46_18]|uniref:Polysaccharide biosynthesis protein n=1 Tax=Candidatus Collierbacteria bacterium GW2011_GWE1_46_18 TaxID=1618399 RepID=A0A0G1RIK2_9BACT|nr:MAG: hypothetical protein UX41_C0011G0010 [Candidatus Collierbacteria bacterium GW2011_GWE1_46_18]
MIQPYIKKRIILVVERIHVLIFHKKTGLDMNRFLSGLSVVFVGTFFSSIVLYLVNIFGGRIVGLANFGKFQLILSISQFLTIPMIFGLSTASIKYIAEHKNEDSKNLVMSTSFISYAAFTTISAVVLFLFKNTFSGMFGVNNNIFVLSIFFSIFLSSFYISRSFLQGYLKFKMLSTLDIAYSLMIFVSFVTAIYIFHIEGLYGLFFAYSVGYIAYLIFYLLSIRKIRLIFDKEMFIKIIHYSFYAISGSVIGLLYGNVDKLILNKYYSDISVGLYSAYYISSTVVISQIMQIVITLFFPTVSSINNKYSIINKTKILSWLIFIFSTLLSIPITYFSLKIMGGSFQINPALIIVFSINAGVVASYQLRMWLINSDGLSGVKTTVFGSLFIGIVNFLLCSMLIPKYSILGASISLLISNTLLCLYFSYMVIKLQLKYEQ